MHETHKDMHAHTAIVIHSTVRFSVSYPVSAPGNCPNKGALHSFTLLLSHQLFFSSSSFPNTPFAEKGGKEGAVTSSGQSGLSTTNQQSASTVDNAHKVNRFQVCLSNHC